ncbi:putative HECT domain-containing protein, partial [Phytophthora infestans]
MSARRSLSDASASDSGRDDDEFLDAAFDEFEEQDARGFFESPASSTSSPPRRDSSSRRSNAARMLEALEAISHETEGEGVPQSLRGLLEQLHSGDGSVLGGMFPFSQLLQGSGGNPRFQRLLEQIGADQSVHTQMAALSELCETLALSTEEALAVSGFNVDKFVPAVVALLRAPTSMELLLLAARALSTILELYPSAAIPKATAEQAIPSLCEKLLEIEYMDVAELALQILEKIVCKSEQALSSAATVPNAAQLCAQYRTQVIEENGIVALLQFVDFFPLEIQRRAARIVCQLCTEFPLSLEGQLRQGLPFITNLLRSFDHEILQSSFTCLQKLGESTAFSDNSEFASIVASEEICGLLLTKLTSYASLEGASSHVSPTGILRFLSCLLSCIPCDLSGVTVVPSASHLRFVKLPLIATALLAKPEVISENQLLRETLKLVVAVLPIAEELSSTETIPRPMIALAHEILPLIIRVYDVTSRADVR